jgi:hypothetical protein
MPLDSIFSTSWVQDKPQQPAEIVGLGKEEPYDERVFFVKSDFRENLWIGVNIVPFEQWVKKYGAAYGYNPDGPRIKKGGRKQDE